MSESQTFIIDPTVPEGHCGVCRREIPDAERLEVAGTHGPTLLMVTICRSCVSEHAPTLLRDVEPYLGEEDGA